MKGAAQSKSKIWESRGCLIVAGKTQKAGEQEKQ